MLYMAPAEVFIASEFTGAPPFSGITIASIPTHSAVLQIAPKFLTSVNLSKIKMNGVLPSSNNSGTRITQSLFDFFTSFRD